MLELSRPIWITKTAIEITIAKKTLITQEISQLPLTPMALASVLETRQEYDLRWLNGATDTKLRCSYGAASLA